MYSRFTIKPASRYTASDRAAVRQSAAFEKAQLLAAGFSAKRMSAYSKARAASAADRSRSRGSLVAIDNSRGRVATGASLARQIKALVAGKRKDAADVARNTAVQSATTISCLTSSTDYATAASGTGLLDMDGDEALINTVTIAQEIKNFASVLLDPTASADVSDSIRTMIVWFHKPLLVASAAGTLPPVTEVLVTDSLHSLVVPDTQNSGRFTVLYDKYQDMGVNTVAVAATGAYPRVSGTNLREQQFTVKINKSCHFRTAGVSGTPSGHYDSDVSPGQIDKGLLVMYIMVNGSLAVNSTTRLNYTG